MSVTFKLKEDKNEELHFWKAQVSNKAISFWFISKENIKIYERISLEIIHYSCLFALLAKLKIWKVNAKFSKHSLKELLKSLSKILTKIIQDIYQRSWKILEKISKESLKNLWRILEDLNETFFLFNKYFFCL